MLRTEVIKKFLEAKSKFGHLYSYNMECQVNVAQDDGHRIEGEYQGRRWQGWSNGVETWKSFRIPWKANTEPEYVDKDINFNFEAHVEAIGMTGWDWVNKCSRWVAFDFDAIVGHSSKHERKLSNEELEHLIENAKNIEWVTIRKSASGRGLHLYVFLNNIPTQNHTEHAALARAILGQMSAITGYPFESKVDACGGNMWVWHRKSEGTDGFSQIKKGDTLLNPPKNWRNHISVANRTRTRTRINQDVEEISNQHLHIPLDAEHKKLINFLKENNYMWWWDQDHHLLVTHTTFLKDAHEQLGLTGFYETISDNENPNDHNCFMYPQRHGAWCVKRFTKGVEEHGSWEQDGNGWTTCYFNKEPTLAIACKSYDGVEDPKGGFVFREAAVAVEAAALLGTTIKLPNYLMGRKAVLKQHKDGRLIIEVDHDPNDRTDQMAGWLCKNKVWTRISNARMPVQDEFETSKYDDLVRHVITPKDEDYGWMIQHEGHWRKEPLGHLKIALQSIGLNNKEINKILGSSIFQCWKIVNKPFQPEYPGGREWNRNSAQLRFSPNKDIDNLTYPHWNKILEHCGAGLDEGVLNNKWCQENSILKGADYLKCWIASMFQEPHEPLPYLFFYGPQNSGKSIFHESLDLLLTSGSEKAENALVSQSGFNAELEGKILCTVEELDLNKNKLAYNRIKDWVTSRDVSIHMKGATPYHVKNTTHWIHCANEFSACPVFSGDTRITVSYVGPLEHEVPKKLFIPLLEKEAPDFLAAILALELPVPCSRLNIPVLENAEKQQLMAKNMNYLEMFIEDKCDLVDGKRIKFSDFYHQFINWIDDPNEHWTKKRVSAELPASVIKGRLRGDNQLYLGNIWFKDEPYDDVEVEKWRVVRGQLV